MASHSAVPIEPMATPRPLKHHHSRYYVRRVRESLTSRLCKFLCAIFLSLLLIVGIVAFVVWLSLRPHRPRIHIKNFSIPGLNQEIGLQNAQVSFDVTARNANAHIGIYYVTVMEATLYYQDQNVGQTPVLFPFYQPSKNTTYIHGELSGATFTVDSSKWEAFVKEISKGTVVFRLDLKTRIKFKVSTWDSKSHRMHASCDVGVGTDGHILPTSMGKRCPVYFI